MTATALRGPINQQDGPVTESRGSQGDSCDFRQWIDYAQSLGLSRSRSRYLVRYYRNHITGDVDFYEWVLMHADPTGETAVRNVMKGRAR